MATARSGSERSPARWRAGVGSGLYLDLHADLNVPESTLDGALDWMGVAHLLGEEGAEPSLVDVGPRKPLLAPEQILLYGFRRDQSTRAERAAIERTQLDVVEYEEVAAAPAASARQALERLSARCERLLVHFDVDVIDFTDAPLPRTPVATSA